MYSIPFVLMFSLFCAFLAFLLFLMPRLHLTILTTRNEILCLCKRIFKFLNKFHAYNFKQAVYPLQKLYIA